MDPLPPWLLDVVKWSIDGRLGQTLHWASELQLVKPIAEVRNQKLQLSSKGHKWLSKGLVEQYTELIDFVTGVPERDEFFESYHSGRRSGLATSDSRFFGEPLIVQKVDKRTPATRQWVSAPPDPISVRPLLDRALAALEPGVFYRLDSVAGHIAFKEHNPLNAGLPPNRTLVSWAGKPVPQLEEEREEAGKRLIETFTHRRLIPLGCVRAAVDDEGSICIARELSCELYFGRKIDLAGLAAPSDGAGRVVVQPDFSVIVIGANPASLAELTLFCQRQAKGSGEGATILKITRESVVRAARLGLKPAEILARLTRNASNALPANVLKEVEEWSRWVRHVSFSKVTLIRCGSSDAADRVVAVLGRSTERLSETVVAINQATLTAKEREKLQRQGIIAHPDSPAAAEEERQFAAAEDFF